MTLTIIEKEAVLDGAIGIENLDALINFVADTPEARIDLESVTHLHGGILQWIIEAKIPISTLPKEESCRAWLDAAGLLEAKQSTDPSFSA
ncbi:MAG: hypothetical protein AAGH41_14305 [Pseudomonadota bacterium]